MTTAISFAHLIKIAKRIDDLQNEGKSYADIPDDVNALTNVCTELFKNAQPGDDIFIVQGRNTGDDDDAVRVVFAKDHGAAQDAFIVEALGKEPASEEIDEPGYIIIENSQLLNFFIAEQRE